jgi:hypothetical protein
MNEVNREYWINTLIMLLRCLIATIGGSALFVLNLRQSVGMFFFMAALYVMAESLLNNKPKDR